MSTITKYNSIIQRVLNMSREKFIVQSSYIARTESPFSGGGWLTKLSDFLLEEGKKTTDNVLVVIEPFKSNFKGTEYKELTEIIITMLDGWIDENIKISHYNALLTRDPDKIHLTMIINYLKNDNRDNVNSRFDKWKLESDGLPNTNNKIKMILKPFQGPVISYVLNHVKTIYNFFAKIF